MKSCLSFCKVGRKLKKLSGNSESCLEISISVRLFGIPANFSNFRPTFSKAVQPPCRAVANALALAGLGLNTFALSKSRREPLDSGESFFRFHALSLLLCG